MFANSKRPSRLPHLSALLCLFLMRALVLLVTVVGAAALAPVSNLALRGGGFSRKTFNLGNCLQDNVDVMLSIPRILDAYAGPNKIDPSISESVMLAVNSVNNCPYCTGIHGELARMAGVKDAAKIEAAKSGTEIKKTCNNPMVVYARLFGESNGRGAALESAYAVLESAVGKGKAAACRAQCWFLHWGSTTGNTLLSFYKGRLAGNKKCGSNVLFELIFAVYYTPCFLAISATTLMLKAFPKVPKVVNAGIGVVLTCVASIWSPTRCCICCTLLACPRSSALTSS